MLLVQYMSPPTNLLVVDVVVFKHNIKRIVHLINPSAVTARCTLQIKLYIGMYQLVLLNHHKKGRWGPTVTQTYMRSLFSMAEGCSSQGPFSSWETRFINLQHSHYHRLNILFGEDSKTGSMTIHILSRTIQTGVLNLTLYNGKYKLGLV